MKEIKYKITENNQLIDINTGELITKKNFTNNMKKWIMDQYGSYALEVLNLGSELEYKIKRILGRDYKVGNPKENYVFSKCFKVEVRDIVNDLKNGDPLSIHEKGTLMTFQSYLSFPDNSIVVNGETPKIEDLTKIIGIGKTKLYEILNNLENKEIIKRVKLNDRTVIYMNPFLFSCGLVKEETIELFKTSVYNPSYGE